MYFYGEKKRLSLIVISLTTIIRLELCSLTCKKHKVYAVLFAKSTKFMPIKPNGHSGPCTAHPRILILVNQDKPGVVPKLSPGP